jgi:hypothetical protein
MNNNSAAPRTTPADILEARDSLELMLLEYGNVHIETLGQLLSLTRAVEIEYSHICAHRLCT